MKLSDFVLGRRRPIAASMRTIMVLNSKGGSGKTTIATNLAGYFASHGARIVLADFDPQASALAWLAARPPEYAPITGLAAFREPLWVPRETEYVVMDVPAGVDVLRLRRLARRARMIVVPVLPSRFDMDAAALLIDRMQQLRPVRAGTSKIALVANRVRAKTNAGQELDGFLRGLDFPIIAHLRDSQQYVYAAECGLSIFELGTASAAHDAEEWRPLVRWLKARPRQTTNTGVAHTT